MSIKIQATGEYNYINCYITSSDEEQSAISVSCKIQGAIEGAFPDAKLLDGGGSSGGSSGSDSSNGTARCYMSLPPFEGKIMATKLGLVRAAPRTVTLDKIFDAIVAARAGK